MEGEWKPVGDPVIGADPGHRIKGFGKEGYTLSKQAGTGYNKEHAKYLKRTFGFILKKHAREDDATAEQVQKKLRIGIMQHAFGDHSECESEWCKYKLASELGQGSRPQTPRRPPAARREETLAAEGVR